MTSPRGGVPDFSGYTPWGAGNNPLNPRLERLPYEILVKAPRRVWAELMSLEADAGLRSEGTFEGKKCYVFVTRHSGRYAVWVRPKSERGKKDGRIIHFETYDSARDFLNGSLDRPLRAYLY
jgi:hypothetical protein